MELSVCSAVLFIIAFAVSKVSTQFTHSLILAALFVGSYTVYPALESDFSGPQSLLVGSLVVCVGLPPILAGWCIQNLTVRWAANSAEKPLSARPSKALLLLFVLLLTTVMTWLYFFVSLPAGNPGSALDRLGSQTYNELEMESDFVMQTTGTLAELTVESLAKIKAS